METNTEHVKTEPAHVNARHTSVLNDQHKLLDDKSPGVKRVEALAATYSNTSVLVLLASIFLMSYAYDLDGTIRYTYQSYATSSFKNIGLLSTINVLRAVIGAASQPTFAKLADVFGRFELILFSLFFYVIGTIVEATAKNINAFAAGVILYQIGFSGILILNIVLIADMVSLRYRVLATFVPLLPYLVNVWISGNVTSSVLGRTTWNWGIGMWAIILPIVTIPLILNLWWNGRKAKKSGVLKDLATPFAGLTWWQSIVQLFWLLDVVGIILMIAVFALLLVPLTLAGGISSTWRKAHIIAPLVVGFVMIPIFIIWELFTKHPVIPFRLLKDRGVWAALGVAILFDFAWYMQGDYLYTVLIVAYDQSVLSATRITSLYTFVSTLTGTIAGMVIALPRVRRVKPFIVFGTVMWLPAFGLLIYFRGAGNGSVAGVIGAQVLLGFGAGFFTYPTLTAIQAASKHEHMALVSGLYLALFYVGSAFGSAVSGAMYTNLLPGQLATRVGAVSTNTTLAAAIYGDPYTVLTAYPLGTPVRSAVVDSYKHVQRLLCIVGICLVVPIIGFALCLRDPKLISKQSIQEDNDSIATKDSLESH
ncbi:protein of unknown function [Taphrina deformans PYCC 5710]|uniref:Major facilitator superfamily (MFS) profile domain-containing protein n=1 Tax=Taphrina deformans (strain PYCC 5710 / ATCC 11124 / CBS 356.35 / IMI 108563 / JCM 9778 / NBRC 8474) TaxID=1097556 RepID=R4XEZ5_TAPDE|nr:protein of unknown function [Taphrina deformans PYCC 5710]|eukprot:CCG84437.1 protein of unknown function [Taphrina deformans PYCC 5710]